MKQLWLWTLLISACSLAFVVASALGCLAGACPAP